MNPVLMLTRNNLDLTRRAIASVLAQRLPRLQLTVLDNGSTDGTRDWLLQNGIDSIQYETNQGVSFGWNVGLTSLFGVLRPHVLVINNDVILPTDFYASLLQCSGDLVTGIAVDQLEDMERGFQVRQVKYPGFTYPGFTLAPSPHPDFSAFLIRRSAWNKLGPFNERMVHYASDCDYHVRGHRAGLAFLKYPVQYYHERSSTLNRAPEEEKIQINEQANKDREVFSSLYHCLPGSPEYSALFS